MKRGKVLVCILLVILISVSFVSAVYFNILICEDRGCTEQENVFILGEEIYLDYNSEVEGFEATTTLIHPNGASIQLSLPLSIKANQIGTYKLELTASKEDYGTIEKKAQFRVIEEKRNSGRYLLWVLFFVIFVLIGLVVFKIFKIMKRRKMGISKKRVERSFKRQLGRKVKKIEKSKKNLFRRLFHRKKKLPVGRKQELDRKISREKKDLVRQKIGVRKKFARRLGEEKKVVQKKVESERGREKKEKIRRLLARGRRQLSNGNKFGAKNTYRKLRLIHATLKSGEKSRSLYEDILRFHRRLT